MDWTAAAKFNQVFYSLVEKVADDAAKPSWKAGSPLAPKQTWASATAACPPRTSL